MDNSVSKDPIEIGPINALTVVIGSVFGVLASLGLLEAELNHLRDPNSALACDLNSLISCASSLLSPQAHLLTVPNSALGIGAFGGLTVVGLFALLGTRFSRLSVIMLGLGATGGVLFVIYFLYQSATNFFALCPYCMAIWSATIIVTAVLIPVGLLAFESTSSAAKVMLRYTWATIVCLHLLIVIVVLLTMTEQIGGLL